MAQRLVVRDRCLLCKYINGGTGRRHEWLVLWRSGDLSFFRQSKSCGHNKMECFFLVIVFLFWWWRLSVCLCLCLCYVTSRGPGPGPGTVHVGQLGLLVLSFAFSHSFPMPYHTIPRSKHFYLESQGHWSATTGDHFDVHSFTCCPQLGVRRHDLRFTRRSAFWPGNFVPCFSTAVSFCFQRKLVRSTVALCDSVFARCSLLASVLFAYCGPVALWSGL